VGGVYGKTKLKTLIILHVAWCLYNACNTHKKNLATPVYIRRIYIVCTVRTTYILNRVGQNRICTPYVRSSPQGLIATYDVFFSSQPYIFTRSRCWWQTYKSRNKKFVVRSIRRVGQNHIYTVYIRYFWQRNHRIYGHIRCIHTVLANPKHSLSHQSGYGVCVGLARTVYIHRIWPYIWWFSCQNYRIYTVYIWYWPTLGIWGHPNAIGPDHLVCSHLGVGAGVLNEKVIWSLHLAFCLAVGFATVVWLHDSLVLRRPRP